MKNKSTKHFLNGDKKTNLFEKFIYTLFFIQEMIKEKKMKSETFSQNDFDKFLKFYDYDYDLVKTKRPARILQEFYFFKFLENNFDRSKKFKILDVGCMNPRIYNNLKKFFNSVEYVGIDIKKHKNWENLNYENMHFHEVDLNSDDYGELSSYKEFDLIFSQSVLEHVKFDLKAINNLKILYPNSIHLHLIPASLSFCNYLTHGYRRYTYRDIEKISKSIGCDIKISKLGDIVAMRSYLNYFDANQQKKHPFNFLKIKNQNYDISLIKQFLFNDTYSYPLFYAIEF